MSTMTDTFDAIHRGGSAVATVGLPDNITSDKVDADGMMDRRTVWTVQISASWQTTPYSSFIGTSCQYEDEAKAKACYAINKIEALAGDGPYAGAGWVSVTLLAPDKDEYGIGKEVARTVVGK